MKIVQLNAWQGKFRQEIIAFLKSEKPDFVCMQEVNDLKGRSGYKFFATLDEIKEGGGFSEAFMSQAYSCRYMERELEYGNTILSNTPFTKAETVFTRGKYKRHFDIEKDDSNTRNLQVASVKVGNTTLNILNHHGHCIPESKAGDDETMRQMGMVADIVDGLRGPIIMCGDFNLAPDSESLGLINARLTNLSIVNNLKRTYNQFSAVHAVCDYIFVNDRVKVRNFEMSDEILSDHKALILEFDL
jgi:endonuclease/exonuclease/phosphatase family metal-dependent hydrolase